MATRISNLKDANGDNVYPITKVECVYNDSNQNVNDLLNTKADKDASNLDNTNVNSWHNILGYVDWTNMTELYYSTSLSTGNKTLNDSLANYKVIIVGVYNNNSAGWTYQNIPKVLFDTLNSTSNIFWTIQGLNPDRRVGLYKVSNTQVNLYNIDGANRVAIYGLK